MGIGLGQICAAVRMHLLSGLKISEGAIYTLSKPEVPVVTVYLDSQGYLVSRLIVRRSRVTIWVIGVINLLTTSP